MNLSVEVTVEENGLVKESRGYLRDSNIELIDLLEWTKASLLIISDEALKEEQAKGFDKKPILLVDGSPTKPPALVSPLGSIEFVSRRDMKEILIETYQSLTDLSPVLTGHYKSSNFVFHNGKQVATDVASLKSWLESKPKFEDKDLIRFVNIVPYARKLERYGIRAGTEGKNIGRRRESRSTSKSGKVRVRVNQPNGAYYLTSRRIRSKYKRNSVIKFEFITGGSLGIRGGFKTGRTKSQVGRPYLYPSIVISVSESGNL